MKLKSYILVGYLVSTLLTILVVFWAVQRMLIEKSEIYFLVGMTLIASFIGAAVSIFLLSPVFSSLKHLKKQAQNIAGKDFSTEIETKGPIEFQELGQAFNDMSHNLQDTFQSLDESEQEKRMMIAQLSHDIKTPITSIQVTVEGILDGVIKEEERIHYLTTIGRQTERLNKLVEELNVLTLNAQPQDIADEEDEDVFLDQLLIESMSEFQLQIEQEERDVYIQVKPESAKIKSYYDKLSRILVNLLNNAFKYSEPGTRIEVLAQLTEEELTISVKDEGQGILPEDLEKIFNRLYRVETSRNMKTGGHGLGLAIARELAHQLGGEITAESQHGIGSTFTFHLNLK
ncbi:HAMP domain-containing histidine kinase [Streptococcus sp. CF4-2]|uniref:sensor histidine kinase n=1 Tax=unclassified Streptococcus TaxID=2608887 RepID=UPI0020CA12E8|nr:MULTISPECIES: HAMP domain-containing sensor histidine kinase [unclassified Streptococcus]MCP9076544.1 HAMP domain-containing histidine kinase [Streptococcus sp. CF4-3]MCP9089229.1 HAMP domain-containing histidine kinase [Streptococcus sp. CF4-2]